MTYYQIMSERVGQMYNALGILNPNASSFIYQ